jgi:hypothetical protein
VSDFRRTRRSIIYKTVAVVIDPVAGIFRHGWRNGRVLIVTVIACQRSGGKSVSIVV